MQNHIQLLYCLISQQRRRQKQPFTSHYDNNSICKTTLHATCIKDVLSSSVILDLSLHFDCCIRPLNLHKPSRTQPNGASRWQLVQAVRMQRLAEIFQSFFMIFNFVRNIQNRAVHVRVAVCLGNDGGL